LELRPLPNSSPHVTGQSGRGQRECEDPGSPCARHLHDNMDSKPNNDRVILGIMVYCTSLAFAAMIASVEAVRRGPGGLGFEVSWRTGVAFVIGTLVALPCMKVIFCAERTPRRRYALAALAAGGIGCFLYPLRFVASRKLPDIAIGLVVAVVSLTVVAVLLRRIRGFLADDEKQTETDQSLGR